MEGHPSWGHGREVDAIRPCRRTEGYNLQVGTSHFLEACGDQTAEAHTEDQSVLRDVLFQQEADAFLSWRRRIMVWQQRTNVVQSGPVQLQGGLDFGHRAGRRPTLAVKQPDGRNW